MMVVPSNPTVMKACSIPLGVLVQPMADYFSEDEAIPLAECDGGGPFRCMKCGAYVNPGFNFANSN